MPELPEAETIRRDLTKAIAGQTIGDVAVYDGRILGNLNAKRFALQITGRRIVNVSRRGKAIIIQLEDRRSSPGNPKTQFLVVQLRMTGQLLYGENLKEKDLKEVKAVFKLSGGRYLNYNDQRLFGRLYVTGDLDEVPYLKTIGPEPLNGAFSLEHFRGALKKRVIPVKTLLMNQRVVAGIGNIYASEILFCARLNPQKQSKQLTCQEVQSVYNAVKMILKKAVRYRGTSMRNYRDAFGREGRFKNHLKVYGRELKPCFVCRSQVKRLVQSGRSTFFCEGCQK